MIEPEEVAVFKAYVIERSRDPMEGLNARQRALMACIVIPHEIQKWMVEAGAVEPLLASVEKTILAAEAGALEEAARAVGNMTWHGAEGVHAISEAVKVIRTRPLPSTDGTKS